MLTTIIGWIVCFKGNRRSDYASIDNDTNKQTNSNLSTMVLIGITLWIKLLINSGEDESFCIVIQWDRKMWRAIEPHTHTHALGVAQNVQQTTIEFFCAIIFQHQNGSWSAWSWQSWVSASGILFRLCSFISKQVNLDARCQIMGLTSRCKTFYFGFVVYKQQNSPSYNNKSGGGSGNNNNTVCKI